LAEEMGQRGCSHSCNGGDREKASEKESEKMFVHVRQEWQHDERGNDGLGEALRGASP
jgi:hypothetical protein